MSLEIKNKLIWEELQQLQVSLVEAYAEDKGITCDEAFRKLYVGEWLVKVGG